jgi:hypothetical protein
MNDSSLGTSSSRRAARLCTLGTVEFGWEKATAVPFVGNRLHKSGAKEELRRRAWRISWN